MLASATYVSDGSTAVFTFPFERLSPDYIHVFIDAVEVTSFTADTSTSSVTLDAIPAPGSVVRVERQTPISFPLVDFTDNSTLNEEDLDTAITQVRHGIEEATDRVDSSLARNLLDQFDAMGRRITQLADGVDPQDAATLKQVGDAQAAFNAQAAKLDTLFEPFVTESVNAVADSASRAQASASAAWAAELEADSILEDVRADGAAAVVSIATAGATQAAVVEAEGDAQVIRVATEGTTQEALSGAQAAAAATSATAAAASAQAATDARDQVLGATDSVCVIEDVRTGTIPSANNAYQSRPLTITRPQPWASFFNANQVLLQPGVYKVEGYSNQNGTGETHVVLTLNSVNTLYSGLSQASSTTSGAASISLSGILDVTGSARALGLLVYSTENRTAGLGKANFAPAIPCRILLTKIG